MPARVPREWRPAALSAAVFAGLLVVAVVALVGHIIAGRSQSSIVGHCQPFNVYAQNQFEPYGALIWERPSPTARNYRGFAANQLVTVDGWVRTRSPYLSNAPPWDSDVWYHLANGGGWVSFAGVRAVPTTPGPRGNFDPGSSPAPVDNRCAGTPRP